MKLIWDENQGEKGPFYGETLVAVIDKSGITNEGSFVHYFSLLLVLNTMRKMEYLN